MKLSIKNIPLFQVELLAILKSTYQPKPQLILSATFQARHRIPGWKIQDSNLQDPERFGSAAQ